jgi:hypothetical protein
VSEVNGGRRSRVTRCVGSWLVGRTRRPEARQCSAAPANRSRWRQDASGAAPRAPRPRAEHQEDGAGTLGEAARCQCANYTRNRAVWVWV